MNTHNGKIYQYTQHMFDNNGKITDRVKVGLEYILESYTKYIKTYAKFTDNNPKNFKVDSVYIVGSGARENRADSDLDLMLIVPTLDTATESAVKAYLSVLYFNNKPKNEAIDAFVRSKDKFPERDSVNITNQVKPLINKYNKTLEPSRHTPLY